MKMELKGLIIAMLVGSMIYSIVTLTWEYAYHNRSTKVSIDTEAYLQFPAVTICNKNQISYLKLMRNRRPDAINMKAMVDEHQYEDVPTFQRKFKNISRYLSEETRNQLLYSVEDVIQSSHYNELRRPINSSEFTTSFTHLIGNCFTFNSAIQTTRKTYNSMVAGRTNGVTFKFKTDPNDTIPGYTLTDGILILVHSPFVMPHGIVSTGFDVIPGTLTDIAVKQKKITRMNQASRECFNGYNKTLIKAFPSFIKPDEHYDHIKCDLLSFQLLVIKQLNCCNLNEIGCFDHPDLPTCGPDSNYTAVVDKLSKGVLCKPACKEIIYETTINSVPGPTRHSYEQYPSDMSYEDYSASVGIVNVYYSTISLETSEDISRFTIISLVSGIGGYAGLYVGISFLSIFSLLEAAYRKHMEKSRKRKQAKRKIDPVTSISQMGNHNFPEIITIEDRRFKNPRKQSPVFHK